ncbi:MAG: BREX-1 system phosphatase PglZ type A [Methanobrevibacter sp.]|jgi:uncharacterized protein (TIGR02687 family)|nr:BREX-1 system phosphatase PglZ type A [Candidatus Methanoflexus mossambicus]
MDIERIQSKLLELFNGENREIVFWFDENSEFQEEIAKLNLENIIIHHLTGSNWIYTKYLLEIKDKENNYLIYAPFAQSQDKDNNLADTIYYSKKFSADKMSFICDELNIPIGHCGVIKEFSKFYNNQKRVETFKSYNISDYSKESVVIAILSVLVKNNVSNFDEVLQKLLTDDNLFETNEYLTSFKKMNVFDEFYNILSREYGYLEENPNLNNLLKYLLLIYTSIQIDGDVSDTFKIDILRTTECKDKIKNELNESWNKHIQKYGNNIRVFINNLMNNRVYSEKLDINANKLKLKGNYFKLSEDSYRNCDAFRFFDEKIISYIIDLLNTNKQYSPEIKELIENRKTTHYYNEFVNQYQCLKWVNFFIKNIHIFKNESKPNKPDDLIFKYSNQWFLIDKAYRKFYFYYGKIKVSNKSDFNPLKELIENLYLNVYLDKLSKLWSDNFNSYDDIKKYDKQYKFYKQNFNQSIDSKKLIVIISDGFRYECGDELKDLLNKNPQREAELDLMISTVPSITDFGMAALLPHNEIEFKDKILLDGNSIDGISNRQKVLNRYSNKAKAFKYEDIKNLGQREIRSEFKDLNIIYIYHNQIDTRGDNAQTEDEVFDACDEAIKEIIQIIQNTLSANYIVTSDHGFIYRESSLNAANKINLDNVDTISSKKRYLLSKNQLDIHGTKSKKISYLSNDLYLTVPNGMDIFKSPGSSLNYVHGGASLQEIIVPLIRVHAKRDKIEKSIVKLNLLSPVPRKITNLNTNLSFAQDRSVSDKFLASEAKIYIEDKNGEKISDELIIYADRESDNPKDLELKEKITIKDKSYSKDEDFYLIIKYMDLEDGKIRDDDRIPLIIDIAFADGFDF